MIRTIVAPVEARPSADLQPRGNVQPRSPQIISGVRHHEEHGELSQTPEFCNHPAPIERPGDAAARLGKIVLSDGREKISIDRVLGAGGMSIVYSGVHRVTGQPVAVKVIRPEYAHLPELVARFQREAEILASITSNGVVRLLDCDVTSTGLPYMVLERLEGQDLGEVLETQSKLKPKDAVALIVEVTRALAPIHRQGIIHRDIKPDNLFLQSTRDGGTALKLLDFGVASSRASGRQLTLPGTTMGTLRYMSPEQLTQCHAVTPASDVWSLGVVLFQLLSGELPFAGPSDAEYSSQVLNKGAANLRAVAPSVPKQLSDLVARCLHTDPWKRFNDADHLATALVNYLELQRDQSIFKKPIRALRSSRERSNTDISLALEPKPRWSKKYWAFAGIVSGLALGYLMPHDVRTEVSDATMRAIVQPLRLVAAK
jgi:serine/threonine protein kinase